MIFLTSDLHLGHNQPFIYEARGFKDIREHDFEIVQRWNSIVTPEDDVYVLGDLMLNDNLSGIRWIRCLNGKIHFIRGNHDTPTRIELYTKNGFKDEGYVKAFKYHKYHIYLSHYPTVTSNGDIESLHQVTLNMFGHTHSKDMFYNDLPWMFNVALDAHNCCPISLDLAIELMKDKLLLNKEKENL